MTLLKPGGILFAAVICVSLSCNPAAAQATSDFEKLLQDAVQSNKSVPVDGSETKKTGPNEALPSIVDSAPVKTTGTLTAPPLSTSKPAPVEKVGKKVEGGWTTVAPNSGEVAVKTVEPVKVAELKVHDRIVSDLKAPEPTVKAEEPAAPKTPEVAVWDAIPKVVEPATSWNNVDGEDEAKAPLNWNVAMTETTEKTEAKPAEKKSPEPEPAAAANASPWDAILNNMDSKKEEPKNDEPKNNTPEADKAKNEPTKTEDVKKEEPKAEEAKKEEPKAEPKKTEEDKTEESKKAEKPKAASKDSTDEMSNTLDALEKDGKDKKNPTEPKKVDEKKPLRIEEPAKAESAKKDAKTEDAKPKTDPAKDKTETAKAEKKEPEKQPEKKVEAVKVVVREFPKQVFSDFDTDTDETKQKLVDARRVGDPNAPDKIKLMYDEIINGLKTRNVAGRYEMWKSYAMSTLRNTAGLNTGSELDGRCRLNWYKKLFADPIKSIFEVEEFSRAIHHGLSGSHRHIAETMSLIREKMDVPARNDDGVRFLECKTPIDAVNEVKRCLLEAQMAHAKAISTLTSAELAELEKGLVSTFSGSGCVNGHTIPNRTYGRRLTNMMEKMDKSALYQAAEALLPLTNPSLLALLDQLKEDTFPVTMVNGQQVQRLSTSAGDIVISGREGQTFDLDSAEMRDVVCVISLGGNDHFREGTCGLHRPVLAIVNLHGNDTYSGTKPGIQGGSVLGVSILVDVEGDDKYSAADVAQGSSIGGAGMLFDFAGRDDYRGIRRVQGHALCGLGLLIDRKGDDKYRAALWAQGFGAPGGFGVLEDCEGNDNYYCGGMWADSYPEHPGYDGWGQGIGAGLRQVGNGGIGMILDGAGNDSYEVDYFGHGGGYWLGIGVARDFGGNDIRHGTTRTAYNGGPRREKEWTRFANGFGCHYALGYLFDDAGNDVYGGQIMGTGMAWDLSIGYLCDFNGNDRFTATGGMTQGVGAEGSIGILFSYGGDDEFLGRNQGYASGSVSYHSPSNCGGNISFLINYGGNDKYGSGAKNNSYMMRGTQAGFLIDRPTAREAAAETERFKEMVAKREKEIEEYDEMVKKGREEAAAKGRRYAPRTRRPAPISADQMQRLGPVPHFDTIIRTSGDDVNVK